MNSDPNLGIRGEFTETAWLPPARLSFDKWSAAGLTLQSIQASHLWWLGDWLAYGHAHYGEKYVQAIEATGHRQETLRGAQWVAERVAPGRRRKGLSWTHHKCVASLPIDQADELLQKAESTNMSTRDLAAEVTRLKGVKPTLLQIAGPITIENEPPQNARELEPEKVNPANSVPRGTITVMVKGEFLNFWEGWLSTTFPNSTDAQRREIAEWWWDALGEYGLTNQERAA